MNLSRLLSNHPSNRYSEMNDEQTLIEAVKVIRVQLGDIIVLRYPGVLSQEAMERLRRTFVDNILEPLSFKNKVKVAILEEGMDIEIMRKEESNDCSG